MGTMNIKLLAELQENCQKNGDELVALLRVYDLTELGRKVFDARCDDVINRVLADYEFYAEKECARCGVAIGDRITDESNTFLLSEKDLHRLHKLSRPIMVAENLTDEEGYFTERWGDKVCEARNELYQFICEKIVPEALSKTFWDARWNVTTQHKLIDITRNAVIGKKAE